MLAPQAWRRRLAIPLVAATAGALVASDWPVGVLNEFWAGHQIVAGVVSGLVLLVVGYLGIESWFARHSARRWEFVRDVAFKSLGKAADDIRRGMDELLAAAPDEFVAPRLPERISAALAGIDGQRASLLERVPVEDHARRLALLCFDRTWISVAIPALDGLKHAHRDHLASWAPVMLATEELADVLNSLANLNERIFDLQAPLRRLRDARPAADSRRPREDLVIRWLRLVAETVFVQEELMRQAVDPRWEHHIGRARLMPRDLDLLDSWHLKRPFRAPRGTRRRREEMDVATGTA